MSREDSSRMHVPNLDDLLTQVESKFMLITLVSKRARQLTNGSKPLIDTVQTKAVTVALEEIGADKIKWHKIPGKGDRADRDRDFTII